MSEVTLEIEQLDVNTPIVDTELGIATPYFEDYLYRILEDLNTITAGTVTGAENLGTGAQSFAQLADTLLQFRTITSDDGSVTITQSDDEIDLAATSLDPGTVNGSILTWQTDEWSELEQVLISWSGGQITFQSQSDGAVNETVMQLDYNDGHHFISEGEMEFEINGNPTLLLREDEVFIDMANDPTLTFSNGSIDVYTQYYDTSESEYVFRLQAVDHDFRFLTSISETMMLMEDGGGVTGYYDGIDVFRSVAAASGGLEANNTSTGTGYERVLTTSDLGGGGSLPDEVTVSWLAGVATWQVEDDGATFQTIQTWDADGAVGIYHDAGLAIETWASGVRMYSQSGAGNNGQYQWYGGSGASPDYVDLIKDDGNTNAVMTNRDPGGDLYFRVRDAADSENQVGVYINADDSVDLYYDGDGPTLRTTGQGIQVEHAQGTGTALIEINASSSTLNSSINFEANDLTYMQIQYQPSNAVGYIRISETDNDIFRLWGLDSLSATIDFIETGLEADGHPVRLFYDGEEVFTTDDQGAIIQGISSATATVLNLIADTDETIAINMGDGTSSIDAQIAYVPTSDFLRFRVNATGEDILLTNQADGDMALFEGGASVTLYEAGTAVMTTVSNGLAVAGPTTSGYYLSDGAIGGSTLGSFQHNGTVLRIYSNEHGTDFNLVLEDAVGTARTVIDADPDGQVILQYDGADAFGTVSVGAQILDPSGANQQSLYFSDSLDVTSTFDLAIQAWSDGNVYISNGVNSGDMYFRLRDSGGVTDVAILAIAEGEVQLYHNALEAFRTDQFGAAVVSPSSTNPVLYFRQNDGTTNQGFLQIQAANSVWQHLVDEAVLQIQGTDTGSNNTVILVGDPDGSLDGYYDGVLAFRTAADGIDVVDTTGDDPVLNFYSDTPTRVGYINCATGFFDIRGEHNSQHFRVQMENSGGVAQTYVEFDPDGPSLAFHGNTPITQPDYTLGTYTTDRNLSSTGTATLDEVVDVLSTLIADLTSYGLLQ